MKFRVVYLAACLAVSTLAGLGSALADYPSKPITILVGFGAGGGVDSISRAASDALSEKLGQAIVIKNKPGGGGALAATTLKSMPADGYTLAAVISTTVTFDPHAGQLPFGSDDFEYIAAFGVFPEALVALPSKNWKTFADVVAAAKKKGSLTYASTTSLDKVVLAEIAKKEGVTFKPVPTKGGAEAVAQTLGGHVDFAYSSGTYYAQAKAGKLHVLAGLGTQPVPGFEKAPTLTALGYDVSSVNMVLYIAPKGLPAEAKAKLVSAFKAASTAKAVRALLAKRNMGTFTPTGDEVASLIKKQSAQFAAALKK
jgi:tripartite-type tricarboxylate transporter receptor subunit TctC